MNELKFEVEQFQWHTDFKCPVEIMRIGHFSSTVIVRLPDGKETETDLYLLQRLRAQ